MTTSGGKTLSSDDGKETLRVNRPGFLRIALRLPPDLREKFPSSLSLACYKFGQQNETQESVCRNLNLLKIVRLDENFRPFEVKLSENARTIKSGEKTLFKIPLK